MASLCKASILICTERDGDRITPARASVADAVIRRVEGTDFSMLEISLVVPAPQAEALVANLIEQDVEITLDDLVRILGEDAAGNLVN